MRNRSTVARVSLAFLVSLGLLALVPCGDATGLPKRYPVSGNVTYKGEAVKSGTVVFEPADNGILFQQIQDRRMAFQNLRAAFFFVGHKLRHVAFLFPLSRQPFRALGDSFSDYYATSRKWELKAWQETVTDWERERYERSV